MSNDENLLPYGSPRATIQVRRRGELPVVGVLVAIQALRELHLVKGIFTRRSVAFFTGNARMLSFQRIVRIRMFFHTKLRRFPAIYSMALLAFTFAGRGLELAACGDRGSDSSRHCANASGRLKSPQKWHPPQPTCMCIPSSGILFRMIER